MDASVVIGMMERAEPDGSHIIEIEGPRRKKTRAVIPAALVQKFVWGLQRAVIERVFHQSQLMAETVEQLEVITWTLRETHVALRGPETNLSIHTDEVGALILKASDQALLDMKNTIDEVLASRATASRLN